MLRCVWHKETIENTLLTLPGHTLFCHTSVSLEMPRTSFATSETLLTLQIYDLFHNVTFTTPPAIDIRAHTHTHTQSLPLHLLLQHFLLASMTAQIIRQALRLEFRVPRALIPTRLWGLYTQWGDLFIFHTYICDRDDHHRVLLFWKSHPGEDRGQCLLQVTIISSVDSGNTQCKGNCRHRNMVSFQSTEKNVI